jgi:hypothetical protein
MPPDQPEKKPKKPKAKPAPKTQEELADILRTRIAKDTRELRLLTSGASKEDMKKLKQIDALNARVAKLKSEVTVPVEE